MVSVHGIMILLPLIVTFFLSSTAVHAAAEEPQHAHVDWSEEMVPLVEGEDGKMEMEMVLLNLNHTRTTRRKMGGSFQICAVCTCCGGARGVCLPSPCCYAINCNIPNRPFGFCSFTPKTCNCFGCHG